MPIINGRYYMNPQYGAALERARMLADPSLEEDSSWSEPPVEFFGARDSAISPARPRQTIGSGLD